MPNYDVFLLALETSEVRQITTEEHAQMCPRTYGDTIVWLDSRYEAEYHNPRHYDVYAYDLSTSKEKRLTSATTADGTDLSTDGNLVVWADNRNADPEVWTHPSNDPDYNNDIYVYDLNTGQEKRITSYPGNDHYPDIDGNKIVWLRQEDYIRADVFVYNLETGRESRVSKSRFAGFQPFIHEDRVVWVDARVSQGNTDSDVVMNGIQGQTDIYLYDLETRQETKLTSTVPGQVLLNAVINGDFVVYMRVSMIESIVYGIRLDYKQGR
jgi:beta propeller repeat protein